MSFANDDGLKEETQNPKTGQNEKKGEVMYRNSYTHTEKTNDNRTGWKHYRLKA